MAGPRYIADPAEDVRVVALDGLSVLYHAPSGMTHIVAPPAPEILEALQPGPADIAELIDRLRARYELEERRRRHRRASPRPSSSRRGWCAAHEAQPRLADRAGGLSGRLGLGRADRDARRALCRLSRAGGRHCDFTVRLEPEKPWRRWLRPSVAIRGDYVLPDAAPLPLAMGLLAAEMGMNLQMALGQKRYLLLHASSAEKDGRALIMTGESGAGKSTLSALLGERGWRLDGRRVRLARSCRRPPPRLSRARSA